MKKMADIDYRRIVRILKSRAEVLNLIGRNERALADLEKGLMISKRQQDKKFQADCHLQFSDIYNSVSRYEDMLSSAEESLCIYRDINDKKGEAESLN
ncbi:MAG: hypothetical protein Q8O74_05525, partial [bacterium]|nr:hypothetical protein [bacterium]